MRSNLSKLYTLGFEFWKIPLGNNQVFIDDVIEMCQREEVAERILGTEFLR